MTGMSASFILSAARNSAGGNKHLINEIDSIQWYEGFAESEPDTAENGLMVGDWNDVDGDERKIMSRLVEIFEKAGLEVDWCDGISMCGGCCKAVRSEPDSYSWTSGFIVGDGGITCAACMADGWPGKLESLCHSRGSLSLSPFVVDPSQYGYRPVVELSCGWDGPHDTERCKRELDACGVGLGYFFQITDSRQFGGSYVVWVERDAEVPDDLHGDHDVEQYDNWTGDESSEEN